MSVDWHQNDAARRFMWAVQALAAPAAEQVTLFPEFVEPADELALDHEETQAKFLASLKTQLSEQQIRAISDLDTQLERMSGETNSILWTVEALAAEAAWETVRQLAKDALRELGWPVERPPGDRAIYVGGGPRSE